DPHHLYEIGSTDDKGRISGASLASFAALRDHAASFAKLSVDRFWSFTVTDNAHDAERIYGRGLSEDTSTVLGVLPIGGPGFLAADFRADAPRVALLSHRRWKRRYSADLRVVGTRIQLDGDPYTIIGVMPAKFEFPFSVYEIYVPWMFSSAELANRRDHGSI